MRVDEFSVRHMAARLPCTYCAADVGRPCVSQAGFPLRDALHGARWDAARMLIDLRVSQAVLRMTLYDGYEV